MVNPRGQKIADTDLDTLARQLSAGRAQLVTEDKGRLVDRAWQASLDALPATGHPSRTAPPGLGPGAGDRPDARQRSGPPRQRF
ncbi:hypothetical protein G6F59_016960 [Rhizopus arrhizus]|nr:hypothetical protein G6F59_016960 [Rhizopus arrhizus]